MIKYNRVILKLSGESLLGKLQHGIDQEVLTDYAIQIKEIISIGIEVEKE